MVEKLLGKIIDKVVMLVPHLDTVLNQRDLENKTYDYLILDIKKKEELKTTINFIIENKIDIDFYFFINARFKKKRLYIQLSNLKKNKNQVISNIKKIHNFFRIKYNKNISFKKSSKHSVFFGGKNFLLNLKKPKNLYNNTLNSIENLNRHQILLSFNDNLNLIYRIEIKDEYKAL